jgi:site-specific DNA recombinase
MKTAIAYLRLSYKLVNGELIEEDRDGISRQREDIRRLAEQHGAELPDDAIYYEDDTSASKVRDLDTEWWKCVERFRTEKPDFLFGAAADRLSRRLSDLETLDDICRESGSRVITLKEGDYFASSAWPFLAAMAKVEALNTAIRIKRSQLARRAVGKDGGGGHRPYGYAADRMTVIPAEKAIIQEVADRILSGETTNAIVNDLNARKIPSVTPGKRWSVLMVRRMAANPRYAAILTYKGKTLGKAAWPVIIDRGTHEAVLKALTTTAKPREGRPATSLLGGIVRCGVCQATMFSTRSGRNQVPVYRCSGRPGCGRTYRGSETLDRYVMDYVAEHFFAEIDEDTFNQEWDALEALYDAATTEDVQLDLQISELRDGYAQRSIGYEDFTTTLDMLRKQQRKIQKQWADYARQMSELKREMTHHSRARIDWDGWTVAQQREFIRRRIVAVVVTPNGKTGPTRPIEPDEVEVIKRQKP